MMSSPQVLCPDWILSTGSNMHIAKDRAWFREYNALATESFVTDVFTRSMRLPVLGFGTVEITTQCPPGADNTTATVFLENVLHVPTAMCSILVSPFLSSYNIGNVQQYPSIKAVKPASSPHNTTSDCVAYFDTDQ